MSMPKNNKSGNGLPENGNGMHQENGANPNGFPDNGAGDPSEPTGARPPANPELLRLQRMLLDSDEKKSRFSIYDYLGLLWRGKWIILACLILAGGAAAYYTYSRPYIYESSLQILVNEKERTLPLFQTETYYPPDRVVRRELQILTSRPILEKTAARLIERRFIDSVVRDSVIPLIHTVESEFGMDLRRPLSEDNREGVIGRIVTALRKMISVSPAKDADIIQIETRAGDPAEAALVTNTYAEVYVLDNQAQNSLKATTMKDFVADKLSSTRDSLIQQEEELKEFLENNGIAGVEMLNAEDLVSAERRLEEDAAKTRIEISSVSRQLLQYKQQLKDIDSAFVDEVTSATWAYINRMQKDVAALELEIDLIMARNEARASDVWYQNQLNARRQKLEEQRARLNEAVKKAKNDRVASLSATGNEDAPSSMLNTLRQKVFEQEIALQGLKAQLGAIEGARGEIRRRISAIPSQELQMQQLERDKTGLEKIFTQLNEEYNKKVLEEQSVFPTVRIFEPARADNLPVGPKRMITIIMGTMVGFAVGVGVVLLIAYVDTTIHSPDDLEKNGFVVLTTIPFIDKEDVRAEDGTEIAPHMLAHLQPRSPIAESYRSLRTAVQYASIEKPIRKILVASSVPQEGKSTTSSNLATVIAQSGNRTLLVDCDLRRPRQHSVFNRTKEPGLVNCLAGDASLKEAIRPTPIPNLDLLTSGSIPPNPSELLGSRRMREVLADLEKEYDTVILDSPPLGAVTDAVILSTLADSTILVVRAHKTKIEFLEKSRESLERIAMPLLGVVLNDFDVSQSYGSASYKYYRYYSYYNYYGEPGAEGSGGDKRRKRRRTKVKAD